MSEIVGDLWPSDLVHPVPASPIAIMKQQAQRLGEKTGNLVLGDVHPVMDKQWVNLIFDLVMPLLENYRFELLKAAYPAHQIYPMNIYVMNGEKQPVATQEEFVRVLGEYLKSDRVRSVISSFVDLQRPTPPEFEVGNN